MIHTKNNAESIRFDWLALIFISIILCLPILFGKCQKTRIIANKTGLFQ
jgi:hypothetical protein